MPLVATLVDISLEPDPVRPLPNRLQAPVSALSVASKPIAWFRVSLLGAMTVHGLILALLLRGGVRLQITQADAAASRLPAPQMIEVVIVPPSEQQPVPPVEATVAKATEPAEPPPMTVPPDPPPGPAEVPPEVPVLTEQAAPEPSEEPVARVTPPPETTAPATIATAIPPSEGPPPVPVSRPKPARAPAQNAAVRQAVAAAQQVTPAPVAGAAASENRLVRDALTLRIRNAVQAAVRCPASARMMGQSGKAAVAFNYRNGAMVGGAELARSSGTPVLDSAALTAVRSAQYPPASPEEADQMLHLLVWVEEACNN